MLTAAPNGTDIRVVDGSGCTSHFIWRDPDHICAWTKPEGKKAAFYLFKDRSHDVEIVGDGVMPVNGHNTYLPGHNNEWILNDTYPQGAAREQTPYLFHLPTHFHKRPVYPAD